MGTEADGVALVGVSGDHGVIADVTAPASGGPIQLQSLSHGLSDGDIINVSGVVGDASSNGRHVVTIVDGNHVVLDTSGLSGDINDVSTTLTVDDISLLRAGTVVPFTIGLGSERLEVLSVDGNELTVLRGVDGSTATSHVTGAAVYATESSGDYLTGGDWAIRTRVEDVTVKESRLSGDTGADGFLLSLTDSQSFRVRINDNPLLEGVRVVVDNTPIPHLSVHNNLIQNHTVGSGVLVDATDSDVNGNITDNRILSNAHDGIELKLSDSNVGGVIAGNIVNGNQGNGINFDPSSSAGLHSLDFRMAGGHVGDVEAASNSEPIAITSHSHGLRTGDLVHVQDVLGNVAANGTFHVNVLATQLEQAVNLTQTSVVVDDVSGFLQQESKNSITGEYEFQIRIGEERMTVTGIDHITNVMTVVRGVAGTSAGGHAIDSSVDHDSVFELQGSSGVGSSTSVFGGGGRISYSSGGIANNVIDGNTGGAGIFADLATGTQLFGNVVNNTISNNSQGGLMVSSVGTNPADHGGIGYSLVVGGSEAEGNVFDGNTGAGINFTLIDDAVGTFDVQHNTITRTIDDGDSSTNYVGDGLHVELIGFLVGFEAESALNRAVIENNNIGADASTTIVTALNGSQTAVPVANVSKFESLAVPFNVRIGREEMQVTNVGVAELTVVRGVGTFPGEDHEAGDTVFTSNGGNDGRGVAVLVEEDSTVADFYFASNSVVNNGDDGLKYRREDEGRANKVDPHNGQRRAITVLNNTFVNNGASSPVEEVEPGQSERRGAGIDLHMLNGSIDLQDVEIVGNVIEANTGANTSGILVRAEADARLLVDIEDNRIRYNTADGIELSTRENDATDIRQVGGTWVKNQITNNGDHGVQIIGRHGLYDNITEIVPQVPPGDPVPPAEVVVTPLFIGIEGTDPVDGKDRGNVISNNGLDGMTVNRGGAISFANNVVKFNGTGGVDIDPGGINPNQTTSIRGNDLSENTGIGLDINAAPTVIATVRDNLIRNNDDPILGDAVLTGDGIELSTGATGQLHVVATGNFIEGNDGRGVDIRNTGTLQFKVGDPLLPLETGKNEIVGNRLEGVYIVNTADDAQPMDVDSSAPLTAAGAVGNSPDLMLNFDTNVVEDNGIGSSLTGTGVVLRVGTSNGESSSLSGGFPIPSYMARDLSGDTAQEGGLGEGFGPGVASNDGHWTKGNGRVNARLTDNFFDGNFGNDFWVEAYVSTEDPPVTGGTWDTSTFQVSSFTSDPLSRANLIFEGNTGNGMNPQAGTTPSYSNDEQNFKRRMTNKSPAGPFPSGTDARSACLIPWRATPYMSPMPDLPPNVDMIGAPFQYPGMGTEKTFRILTGFDTAGTAPSDQFETGSNFDDPIGPCGWDVVGTNLTDFVSVNTNLIRVDDASVFVGGDGDDSQLLQPGFTFQVDHEEMRVLARNGDVMTVERGFRDTPVQPHLAGTPVGMFTFPDPRTASFPLPDVVDVVPGLRNADAGVISIVYTEDMQNIDIDDFALAYDDGTTTTSDLITGATHVRPDGTKTPVTITSVGVGAHLNDGDEVTISGILGNGAANGVYTISNVTANTFDLGVNEQQHLELLGHPDGGSFTLTYPVPTNEVQRLDMAGIAMDGHFALEFRNATQPVSQMTDPLEFRSTAAQIQAALESLPTIRPGDVIVEGGPLVGLNEVQELEITGTTVGGDSFTLSHLSKATVLQADVAAGSTTISVLDITEFVNEYGGQMIAQVGSPLPAPFLIQIDDEILTVTEAVNATTLTVVRGSEGTADVPHTAGRTVFEIQETIPIPANAPFAGGVHEIQRIDIGGASGDETFTVSFRHPDSEPAELNGQVNDLQTSVEIGLVDFSALTNHRKEPLPTGNPLAAADQFNVRVDDEEMLVVGVAGNTLFVERGINGTDLAVHDALADVFYIETTIDIAHDAPADDSRNDLQLLTVTGEPDGGTFTLTFQHPRSIPGILDGGVGPVDQFLLVDDATVMRDGLGQPLATPYNVVIGAEVIRVNSVVGNQLAVTRAINGTAAGTHADDAEVHHVETTRPIDFNASADGSSTEVQEVELGGNPDGGSFTLSYLDPRAVSATLLGTNEKQDLTLVGNADGGTFTLTFEAPTAVQTTTDGGVLAGDGTIDVDDVSFLPGAPFDIRINSEYLRVLSVVAGTTTLNVSRGMYDTAAAGHGDGDAVVVVETTTPIAFDVDAAGLQAKLETDLPGIAAGDVVVTGTTLDAGALTVEFTGNLGPMDIVSLHSDGQLLTEGGNPNDDEDVDVIGNPEGQSGVGASETVIPVIDVGALFDGLGNPKDDTATPFLIRIDNEEMQVTAVDPVTNTYTVNRAQNGTTGVVHAIDAAVHFVETTGAIDWDATATEVQAMLESLAQISSGDIEVTLGDLPGPVAIEFVSTGTLSYYDVAPIYGNPDSLTDSVSPGDETVVVTENQDGAFSVETALELLTTILDGTELTGNVDQVVETIGVADLTVFDTQAVPFTVRVDNEDMRVTEKTVVGSGPAGTLTVVRGHNDTIATVHASGAQVKNNVSVTRGNLPDIDVEIEFIGTIEHTDVEELIVDSRLLTEDGIHVDEIGTITTLVEGALSVETTLERLPSIVGPELDIEATGGPLGSSRVYIEFRGPSLGRREIPQIHVDPSGLDPFTGSAIADTAVDGVLSVQAALERLVGIDNGGALVTEVNPMNGGLPFFPLEIEFTRYQSATDIPELTTKFTAGGSASTADAVVTTVEDGIRRSPLEVEFTGLLANLDVQLMASQVNGLFLPEADEVLSQWLPLQEDVVDSPWMGLFPIFPPSQDPLVPLSCYYGLTCPTSLVGINETQRISLEAIDPDAGGTGGSFTLEFNGETTAPLPGTASALAVRLALENLTTVGANNTVVIGGPLPVFDIVVEFVNGLANGNHSPLVADDSGLANHTVAVTTYLDGDEPGPNVSAVELVKGGFQSVTFDHDVSISEIQTELEAMVTIAGFRGLVFDAFNGDPVIITTPGHGLQDGDEILIEKVSVDCERTKIEETISAGAQTFRVADVNQLPTGTGFLVQIDDEQMLVTNVDSGTNELTVQRGINGTNPTSHLSGKFVRHIEHTSINGRRIVTVVDDDSFSIADTSGNSVKGDGEYAGGGMWVKMGNVSVTGGPLPNQPVKIEFQGDLALQDVVELIPGGGGLTDSVNPGDEDAVISTLPQGSGISAGGDYVGGGVWIKNLDIGPAGADLTVKGVNEIQEVSFSPTNMPTGGTFTLEFKGMLTDPIAFDASADDVFNALTAEAVISTIGPGNVKVTGGPLPAVPVQVEFVADRMRLNQPAMVINGDQLTGITSTAGAVTTLQHGNGTDYTIAFDTNEFQRVSLNGASGGEFTLTFDDTPPELVAANPHETGLIPWDATASVVQAAFDALAIVNPGDVVVTGGPLPAIPVDIEFTGGYAKQDIRDLLSDDSPSGGAPLVGASSSVSTETDGRRVTNMDGEYTLSILTDDVGPATHDLLGNGLTQLVDGAGNTLNIGANDVWARDQQQPVASFVSVTPTTRNSAVGVVTMDVDEDVVGVDIADFRLTRDTGGGAVNVPVDGLVVTELSPDQYSIDLNLKTSAAGIYELSLVDTDPITPIVDAYGNGIQVDSVSWQTNIVAPSASFAGVATPRNTTAGVVTVNLSEPVTGVDINDFVLTRDGQPVSLVGLSAGGGGATWTLDLSSVTVAEGAYELTLVATDSGIVDDSGNDLPNDARVSWVMDTTAPTLDILDVTPDPRTTDADIVNLIFSEPVENAAVDISDLTLTLDMAIVPLTGVTVVAEGTGNYVQRYTVDLRDVTDGDGSYVLTFGVPGGVADEAGNQLALDPVTLSDPADSWVKEAVDGTPPVADILDVDPDPRTTGVDFATVAFTEDVTGVDIGDFTLTRDLVAVDLSSASVVEITPFRYAVDLSAVSDVDGDYTLTLVASGSGIGDAVGNLVQFDATDSWVKGNTGPNADIVDVAPDPRITAVGDVTILFTDPANGSPLDVTGLDIGDFELRRDGLLLDMTDVSLTAVSGNEYRLDLTSVTGVNGTYSLVLQAENSGVFDGGGNPFVVDASDVWVTDTVIVVNSTEDLGDATPLGDGNIDVDLATPGKQITLRAAIQEANLLPGHDTISVPAGTYTLSLAGVGDDDSVNGDLDVRQGLTIIGAGAGETIVDADGLERVFQIFGGVAAEFHGLTITGGSVVGSEDGGGIRNAGDLRLVDVVVTGNSAEDSGGGINADGSLLLERVTVSNNTAGSDGGGIRNVGELSLYSSTISGNSSSLDGGGLVNISLGNAAAYNTTFSNNVASRDGGAIHNEAVISLVNVTVTANTVDNVGGGISTSGVTSIQNTLVAENVALMEFPDVTGTFNSLGNNLVGNNSGAAASFPASPSPGQANGNGDFVGDSANILDPLLDPNLGDNGGPGQTHVLLLGSVAIDGGNNSGFPSEIASEQRGAPRILDGPDLDLVQTIDIGAVEFGNFYVNSTDDLTDTTPLGDGLVDGDLLAIGKQITLRAALQEANALAGENTILLAGETYLLTMTEPDTTNPTGDIVDVAPDPRDTAVGIVTVNFDEDVIGVDLSDGAPDFVLTRDTGSGPVNVPLTGIVVNEIDNTTYTLDLSGVTDVNGMYSLTLSASVGSIVDLVGNPLLDDVLDEWLTGPDVYAPSADIVDIDPDPRASVAGLVTVDFTEPVTGVDVADFTLTVDFGGGGGPSNIPLAGVAVVQVTPSQYTLDLTGGQTAMDGTYVLSLNATNSGIADLAGNALAGDATDQWVKGQDQVAPTADIVDVEPDPRITNVGLVTVDFSEPVTGVTVDDFSLTRDSGSGAINIPLTAVTVTQLASDQYTINLNTVTGFDGVYVLTLNANATIQDLPGNAMLVDATDTWQRGESSDGSGDLDITDVTGALTIIGVGADGGTTIDANGIDRTFQVLDGVSATLRDLSVTGGVVTGSSEGGAIHNSGSLLAQGVRLFGNLSAAAGGAVFNTSAGDVTLDASTVTQNQAYDGGGVYNSDNAVVTIRNSAINQNVSGNDGGGVYNDLDGMVVVTNSDVIGNAAVGQGGGLYNNDAADLAVSNSRFSVNTSEDGAGIFNELAGEVSITNTTFTANVASGDGGAIYNDDGTVDSDRTIYSSNTAAESGGAIYNTSNGDVTLTSDSLTLNSAPQRGGAINNYGLLTIGDGSLSHNVSGDGGAIATARNLDMTDTYVNDNDALDDGGGVYNDEIGVVVVTGGTFVDNTAGDDGGALSNVDSGVMTLEFSAVSGNQAAGDGGGVHNTSAAGLNISTSLLYDNEAIGGGGGVANDSIGMATAVNTTFSGNQAATGGGVFNQGEFELNHSTVYQNSATDGGGVANAPIVPDVIAMRNTIVANNTSTASGDDIFGTGYQSDGHNLIGNVGTDPNLVASFGSTDLVGTPGSTLDPSLYDLEFNGGPTFSHGLQFGSPARDAGDNTGAPVTDQRGFARLFDGDGDGVTTIDIGAVESGFIVNSFLDSVDVNPNDGISADNDGLSSLRAAINEANSRPGRDTIILPSGTFLLALTGRDDDTGLVGDLDITDDLEILGADDGVTVIDADGIDRVFHVAAGASLSISNVTITGGDAGTAAYGGAVLNSGELVISDVVVTGNVAARGGGVFNAGSLSVVDSTIDSNHAYVQGGGIFNFQSSRLDGTLGAGTSTLRVVDADAFPLEGTFEIRVDSEDMLVTDVVGDVFTVARGANGTTAASHADGATIKLLSGGNVTISSSTISDNSSDAQGGGVYNQDSVEIHRTEVVRNTANSRGGAIYNASIVDSLNGSVTIGATTVTLADASAFPIDTPFDVSVGAEIMAVTSVTGNDLTVVRGSGGTLATPHGDASTLVLQGFASGLISESTLANNSAIAAGGGVYNEDVLNVVNSTISTNSAGAGGGISSIGTGSLSAVTVVNNSAGNAGGIASDGGSMTTQNSLIAANNATGDDVDVRGVFISAGNNLVGDAGSASGFNHGENDDQVGSPASPFDPVIDLTLRDNGGPTRTHRLLPSSPAIDAGDNTGGDDTTDQRGSNRPTNADSDIGAFELAFLDLMTSDVSIVEGSTGSQAIDIPVILSATSVEAVTVVYTTSDGTAFQGSDYQSASGVLTFQPGEITQNITVMVNGDLSVEPTETFFVDLSSPTGAELFGSQAIVTILNDDTAVAIDDATVIEGDSGQVQLDYTVRLVQPIDTPVQITVEVETNDGTAVSGLDYTAVTPTTLVFNDPTDPAQLSQTVSVFVDGDLIPEPDEIVYLDVVSTTVNVSDGRGDGVIQNDDAELTVGDQPTIDEGANLLGPHAVDFPVSLTYASAVPVTVDFATSNGDEIQELVVTGAPTTGTFSLFLDGAQSGDLTWPAVSAAEVQTALEVIPALTGNVTVGGDLSTGAATVTFGGTLTGTDVSELVPSQGSLSGGSIEVTTISEAASSGDDYDAASGTLTFAPGVTSQQATVTVNDDVVLENDETFFVTLDPNSVTKDGVADTNATVGGPGVGTIIDNELPPDEYRLWVDGVDYRVDWTAPDGSTEIYYQGDGVSPPISVLGDRNNLTSASPAPDTDDLLVIDFINGNPIPASGLVFSAGGNVSADVIELRPAPLDPIDEFASADYLVSGIGAGTMSLDAFQVDYTDVEAVFDTAEVNSRSFGIDPAYVGNQEMRTRDAAGVGNSLFEGTGATPFGMFSFRNPDATVGSLVIDAGPGDNTVTLDPMDSTLSSSIQIDGGDGDDTILAATTFSAELHIVGGDGDDVLRGGAGDDLVEGGVGNDSPSGGGGADTLDGGVGADMLAETADADFNLTDTALSVSGEPVDALLSIEVASLTGGASNNAFDATGFTGSVTLNGEAGDDLFFGSAGDDVFNGGVGSDRVEQTTGQGQRLNNSQVEMGVWTFDANSVPTWTFTATSSDDYTGVEQFALYGDAADNVIDAGGYDQGDVTIDGADGNDRLTAGKLNDSVIGGLGNDWINAKSGNDYLEGGDGDDTLLAGYGDDTATSGDGNDFINANAGNDNIDAGNGNDRVRGAEGDDTIVGGAGDDQLDENLAEGNVILTDNSMEGDLGNDVLDGIESAILNGKVGSSSGQGDNYFGASEATIPVTMYGGSGRDTMIGGLSADYLNGNGDSDRLEGGPGDDSIQGGAGKDFLVGGLGDDTIQGQGSNDTLKGENGDDDLDGGAGYDRVFEWADQSFTIVDHQLTGGLGTDVLDGFEEVKLTGGAGANHLDASGFSGKAVLWGAAGEDTLVGGGSSDRLNGGPGHDSVVGNGGADTLFGGSGDDTLEGDGGDDIIYGQRDDDSIKGGTGDDSVLGDDGNDTINGGEGNDTLRGGTGADGISGWTGDDVLNGNSGRDTIVGGTGMDRMFGGNDRDVMLGEDDDDYIKGQTGDDVLSGGAGNDKGVDYAVAELGNWSGEIDEEFTFYDSWIDNI
ncbi:MAG: choice-of-anchor Q domain-containing protein [Planctomycetota bacterium]|nr:choice-of-anchor Q domain-containing protein [Planctomycetota bacterium]